MRYIFLLIASVLVHSAIFSQISDVDSLKNLVGRSKSDSVRFALILQIGEKYYFNNNDSAIAYINLAMKAAEQKGSVLWEAHATISKMLYSYVINDFVLMLNLCFQIIGDYPQHRDPYLVALATHFVATLYGNNGYYKKAVEYEQKAIVLLDTLHYTNTLYQVHYFHIKEKVSAAAYAILSSNYLSLHKVDFALWAAKRAYEIEVANQINWNWPVRVLAFTYQTAGQTDTALSLYKRAIQMAIKESNLKDVVDGYNSITELYQSRRQVDSAILYGQRAIATEKQINYRAALEAALSLSNAYEGRHRIDSALYYYKYAMITKDSLNSRMKVQQVQSTLFKEELREREQIQEALLQQTQYRNRVRIFVFLGIAVTLLSLALILWRNNRQMQKANVLLHHQKQKIESTLAELESTQQQLIQKEKMASLGELTAGIAHEIQNPLNFVNNFSEVNNELIAELKQEVENGNLEEIKNIATDIEENGQKISHHGRRADAIVKGMLQHSRTSSGEKQPTDINALADEYLRLSYQAVRSKDKTFQATIETYFDDSLPKINVVPQDIGRVLLNLFNNAFYAVNEKATRSSVNGRYQPTIRVVTKKLNEAIELKVEDNGTGIPPQAIDKIFQPFFTTKPTVQVSDTTEL